MKLFLLRHGEAETNFSSDFQRALTPSGIDEVKNVANQLQLNNPYIEKCLVSPYKRAQETASIFIQIVSPNLEWETSNLLVPEVGAKNVINALNEMNCKSLLLVSHNPLLSELYALLTEGNIHNLKIVETSEFICLEMELAGIGLASPQYSLLPENRSY